jgi:hypothetical protein
MEPPVATMHMVKIVPLGCCVKQVMGMTFGEGSLEISNTRSAALDFQEHEVAFAETTVVSGWAPVRLKEASTLSFIRLQTGLVVSASAADDIKSRLALKAREVK